MEFYEIKKLKFSNIKTKVIKKYLVSKYKTAIKEQKCVKWVTSLLILALISLYYINSISSSCYIAKHWQDGRTLRDISENKILKTKSSSKNVFFHETSCITDGILKLNSRQACAIESAALTNPDHNIYVMFTSQVGFRNTSRLQLIDALLSYPNVHINFLNLTKYAENTPLQAWIKTDKLFRSKYLVSHTSDVARFLSLYKYGGTHLDLDVIMLQPLDTQKPHNFASAVTYKSISAGIIHLEGESGHEIAEKCILDLKKNFNGRDLTNNGQMVLNRVLNEICGTSDIKKMIRQNVCENFRVLPIKRCYNIQWNERNKFYKEKNLLETLDRLSGSIMAKIWDPKYPWTYLTKNHDVAINHLGRKFCPKTFQASEYF